MPEFEVLDCAGLEEAVEQLARLGNRSRLLAGGTDLLVDLRRGRAAPDYLVRITDKGVLREISSAEGGGLRMGGMVTLRDLMAFPAVRLDYHALFQAASTMATPQVRTRATIGGNLCNASPAADLAPPLLVYGAEVEVAGPAGSRRVPLTGFFRGPRANVLEKGEVLRAIWVPAAGPGRGSSFLKLGLRKAQEIAVVSAAVLVRKGATGRIEELRIALGAAAPTPIRVPEIEEKYTGETFSPALADRIAEGAAGAVRPIDDMRSSAAYRRDMAAVLVKRALEGAWAGAEEASPFPDR